MAGSREYLKRTVFSTESRIMQVFSRIFDIAILNIVFIIFCIPVVTIGASTTAMYSITLKMIRNEESHIIRGFLKAFKENFKQGTILGMIATAIVIFLAIDLRIIGMIEDEKLKSVQIICYMVAILVYIIFLYAFPILARFVCTTKEIFRNSFIISIVNFKWTLILIGINIPFTFMLFYSGVSMLLLFTILIICGFSGIALIQSFIFQKIFRKYELENMNLKKDLGEYVTEGTVL